jgi:hypothetical protein
MRLLCGVSWDYSAILPAIGEAMVSISVLRGWFAGPGTSDRILQTEKASLSETHPAGGGSYPGRNFDPLSVG